MPLITFPWLFEKELGRIATGIEAIDDLEDLGLEPLVSNGGQAQPRRRQAAGADTEDFIQQENGVIVHRGEELDLFRPDTDPEDLSGDSDFEEARYLNGGERYVLDNDGETVLATAFPESAAGLSSGTGVEDVVPRIPLDGFIDNRQKLQELGSETGALESSWPLSQAPKPVPDCPRESSAVTGLSSVNGPAKSPTGSENSSSSGTSDPSPRTSLSSCELETREQSVIEEVVGVEVGESSFERTTRKVASSFSEQD